MIYEHRVYDVMPGKMAALQRRFAEHTVPRFEKYGMTVIGCWTNYIGGANNQLIYMLAFESLSERERIWEAYNSDPETQQIRSASEADGPLVSRITNAILRPTSFSPLP